MFSCKQSALIPPVFHSNFFGICFFPTPIPSSIGQMAERSKALASGASSESCVGSNPTLFTIAFCCCGGIRGAGGGKMLHFLLLDMAGCGCAWEPRDSGATLS